MRQEYLLSLLLFTIILEMLQKIKAIQIETEEIKLSLILGDMIVYIENSMESTKTQLTQKEGVRFKN